MKAIGFTESGGPEALKVVDLPEPEPGTGGIRIRVHAAGVDPTDITFRSGGRATLSASELPHRRHRRRRRRTHSDLADQCRDLR
jgi:NADPH:quinone reductase-like Zn-dependent oxidoreductase